MTREEAKEILAGYVKACNEDDFLTLEMFEYEKVIEAMAMGAKALSVPSLPSNLDEAATQAANQMEIPTEHSQPESLTLVMRHIAFEMFKAGAEWLSEQGETLEGEVVKDINNQLGVSAKGLSGTETKFGDKVIVQVRKK